MVWIAGFGFLILDSFLGISGLGFLGLDSLVWISRFGAFVWISRFGFQGLDSRHTNPTLCHEVHSWVSFPWFGVLGLDSWVWSPEIEVLGMDSLILTPGQNLPGNPIKTRSFLTKFANHE